MLRLLYFPLVFSSLVFAACGRAPESTGVVDRPTENPAFTCSVDSRSIDCVEEACKFAGGQFQQDLKKCSCGASQTFLVRSGQPRCADNTISNSCFDKKRGFQNASTSVDDWGLCSTIQNKENLASVTFDVASELKPDVLQLAKWADKNLKKNIIYNFWESPTMFGEFLSVGGEVTNKAAVDGFLRPFNLPDEPVDYLNFFLAPKYFDATADLVSFLTDKTTDSNTDSILIRLNGEYPDLETLLQGYASISRITSYKIASRYSEGCLRSCVATSDAKSFGKNRIWFVKYFFHGIVYRSEVRISSDDGIVRAVLLLADRAIAGALDLKREPHGALDTVTAFSARGEIIFKKSFANLSQLNAEQPLLERDSRKFNAVIGVCEEGLSPTILARAGLPSNILRGPATSFYGWANSNDPAQYWSGRLNLNAYGVPDVSGSANHAAQTASILLESSLADISVGLIPIGIESCVYPEKLSAWWSNAVAAGVKVFNFSAREELDEDSCKAVMKDHPMITAPNSALWVAAAGNEGSAQSTGCPQHLAGQENLIIVGASDGDTLNKKSNFGASSVDIAADGNAQTLNQIPAGWGTSFAAPRVSRAAVELMEQYPTLSPRQIKQAILLGARIPKNPLPVLSMGVLDVSKAHEVAERLLRNENPETFLPDLFCHRRLRAAATCAESDLKIELNKKIESEWTK